MGKLELENRLIRFRKTIGSWELNSHIKNPSLKAYVKLYEAFLESELVRYSLNAKTPCRQNLEAIETLLGNTLTISDRTCSPA